MNPIGTGIPNGLMNPVLPFPISMKCSALVNIFLRSCDNLTDTCSVGIGLNCPLLSYINLEETGRITKRGIITLAEGCLTGVDFSFYVNISDIGIVTLARRCPMLSFIRLVLPDTLQLSDDFLLALGDNCHHLRTSILQQNVTTKCHNKML